METYNNIFSVDEINYLINLPEVISAKNQIDIKTQGSIYFSVSVPNTIKNTLHEKIGLDLTDISKVPMRWIKGDTQPHIDTGINHFDNTYLVYLVDSVGHFVINDVNYPISSGTAYIFPENINHRTIDTGAEPRLLLGPMSETGFAVGAPSNIYIRQDGTDIQYSYDQTEWNVAIWPYDIYSSSVEFITDINITSTNQYFVCLYENATFGSISLNNDGTRPIITIDGVINYPGLIRNGSSVNAGYDSIRVFNLEIRTINDSTLATDGGWVCQSYFGNEAQDNYIINCSSDGFIIDGGGGIVGAYSGSGDNVAANTSSLYIIGCSSSGDSATYSGGIAGLYVGCSGGSVTCQSCWSTGAIGADAGGIVGYGAASNGSVTGYVEVIDCYSTGVISGDNSGGIFGRFAGNASQTKAENCYSSGSISGTNAGGIYGNSSASDGGIATAVNCYSSGALISGLSNGIFSGGIITGRTATDFYVANNNWSSATANSSLTGTPSSTVGTVWVANGVDQPYQLRRMGYTPYSLTNIDISETPELVRTFNMEIEAGEQSEEAIISGRNYEILQGGGTGITINSTTGIISTTLSTTGDTYTIYVRNTGSYHITIASLTVLSSTPPPSSDPLPCLLEDTEILTPNGYVNIKKLKINDEVVTGNGNISKVTEIFTRNVKGNDDTYPCIIPKEGISSNYPPSNLVISQNHLIRYYDQWIRPKDYFPVDTTHNNINYYHIKLENYLTDDLVINNGVIVESYSTNNEETFSRFMNRFRATTNDRFYH